MFKRLSILIILLFLLSTLFNCSTMFNGGPQSVSVDVDPGQANIIIKANSGQEYYNGRSPVMVELPRKYTYVVEISLAGYQKQVLPITHGVQGWFWGNILCGGLIGMVIDGVTGNMWELEPSQFNIKLQTAMINTKEGPAVAFYTKDDNNQLRYVVVPLIKA